VFSAIDQLPVSILNIVGSTASGSFSGELVGGAGTTTPCSFSLVPLNNSYGKHRMRLPASAWVGHQGQGRHRNEEAFNETRTALFAKMKGWATDRIPDYAFKSENAWKEYMERRRIYKEKSPSIPGRVGRQEAQSGLPSSSTLTQSKQPPKKSGSIFDGLRRLTQRNHGSR
jgi:hypothetical protein